MILACLTWISVQLHPKTLALSYFPTIVEIHFADSLVGPALGRSLVCHRTADKLRGKGLSVSCSLTFAWRDERPSGGEVSTRLVL